MTTLAFLLASSGAVVDPLRLQGGTCPEAGGGALDELQLLQKSILQEVRPQRGGIAVTTASKTAKPGTDGQATAPAHLVLTRVHWHAIGPDWIRKGLFAAQGKTVALLIVGVTAMAVLVLLYFCFRLPVQHRRSWKAVELPEIGESGALKTNIEQQPFKMFEEVTSWSWNGSNWQGRWAEAMLRT